MKTRNIGFSAAAILAVAAAARAPIETPSRVLAVRSPRSTVEAH